MPPETSKPADQNGSQTAQVTPPSEPISVPTLETQTAHLEGNEPNSANPAPNFPSNPAPEVVPDLDPVEEPAEAKPPVVEPEAQAPVETQEQPPEAEPKAPKQPEQPQVATTLPPQNSQISLRNFFAKAKAVIQRKKIKKLEKIIAEIVRKGKISNDEVEKILHVSDATATRYLSQLEKEGKIKQTGKAGRSVFYTKM